MLILGGFKDQQRFELLQSCILKLITGNNDTGCDDDDAILSDNVINNSLQVSNG
jgi:hypothetical protein